MNTHTTDETGLDNYERNHWFRGKMVTARDLDAEWAYHADRLNTLARLTVGEGIVCGLETAVTQTDPTTLSVQISPGIGIDSLGRHVVVRRTATREVSVDRTQTRVHLYLTYRECGKESVPAFDDISACEDDRCEYNRVLETFDLHVGDSPPAEEYGRVKPLAFPSLSAFPAGFESLERLRAAEEENGNAIDGAAVYRTLMQMSRSYNGTGDASGSLDTCRSTAGPLDSVEDGTQRRDQPAVFIGTFAEGDSGWSRDEDVPLRFVPTNPQLHDALVDHAAQFDNPHQVRLDAGVPQGFNRGLLFAAHEASREPVSLTSSDGNIEYRQVAAKTLDLTVPDIASLEQRITALEAQPDLPLLRRYVFDKTMKYKLESFRDAAEAFDGRLAGDVASDIAAHTLTGIDQRWYTTPELFGSYLFDETLTTILPERVTGSITGGVLTLSEPDPDGAAGDELTYTVDLATQMFDPPTITAGRVTLTTSIFGLEALFVELVEGAVPAVASQRYRNALDEFAGVPKPGDQDMPTDPAEAAPVVLELAVLQDQLCEAVDWLVEDDEPPAVDTRPVGNVFEGQSGVDLSVYRAAPDSGAARLFDVSNPSDSGVEIPDIEDATIGSGEFAPGSYGFEETRTTTSVVVIKPEISTLTLTARGRDVTTNPIPAGTTIPVAVSASFNFSSVEGVDVTVTNDETGDDITGELTSTSALRRSSDTIALDVSGIGEGTYTVTVAGETMFDKTIRTVSFAVVDAAIDLVFNPSSVSEKNITVGTFTSALDEPVFVLVPKARYQNSKLFDNLHPSQLQTLLKRLLFGESVESVDLTDEYLVAQLQLKNGDASFRFNTSGLITPREGDLRGIDHVISIASHPEISFPPEPAEKKAILATAKIVVRASSRFDFPREPIDIRDPSEPHDPFDPRDPIDPRDIVISDPIGGGVIILPADGSEFIVFDSLDENPVNPADLGSPFDLRRVRDERETETESEVDPTVILDDIRGIGDARARKLSAAGVTNLSTLAESDSKHLANIAGVTVEMAESWIAQARDRIGR